MDEDFLASNSSQKEESTDLGDTIRKVYYRVRSLLGSYWWILLFTLSVGIAYKALQVRDIHDSYHSSAQLMIRGQIEISEADRMREVATNFHENQLHLMNSGWVRQRAHERVAALHPELERGHVNLHAAVKGNTDIFILSAYGGLADYTREYLDEVIEAYLEYRRQARHEKSDDVMLSIDEEIRELDIEIQQTQRKVREFQQNHNIVAIQQLNDSATERLAEVKELVEDYRTQLRILESFDERASLDQIADIIDLNALQSAQNYQTTKRQLQQYITLRDQFAIYLKPKHPKMIGFNEEIENLQNRIDILRNQAFVQIEERKDNLRKRVTAVQPELDKWRTEVLANSSIMDEFDTLNSQLKRAQTSRDNLIVRQDRLEFGKDVDTEIIDILSRASPPILQQVNKQKEIMMGGIMGLMAGAAIIFLIAILNNKISTADDIKRQFDGKVVGLIPLAKSRITLVKKDSNHVFAEGFRALRSSILLSQQDAKTKQQILLVTSSAPSEGKSTVSSNLAATLAYSGAKTLLVDCDLRRGHLHDKFGISREPGLAELLENPFLDIGEITLNGDKSFANLSVITAGKANDNPGDLFLSERMDEILAYCRTQYDYVILDTAPLLAVDDTIGMLKKSDAILFVARANKTTFRQLKQALERLGVSGRRVWGFVLNYVNSSGGDYYYYSRYKSYRYHEQDKKKMKSKPRKKVTVTRT